MIYIPLSVDESIEEKTKDNFFFRSFHEEVTIPYQGVVYSRKTKKDLC